MKNIGPAMTWEELANYYGKRTGGRARIRPMNDVFDWAKSQETIYYNRLKGTLHMRKERKT